MSLSKKVSVLFVCLGNICRSPTAEGVFRHIVESENLSNWISTDSAGTHAYHIGKQPDHRSQLTARSRGIDLSDLRGRKAVKEDFERFDYIIAMDNDNYYNLQQLSNSTKSDHLKLFLEFTDKYKETEVPDPYYGGDQGFEHVFDLVESASYGLLEDIKQRFS